MSEINEIHINKVIKHCKIKFFRRGFELTLFGIMSYKYEWLIHEFDEHIEGFVALSLDQVKPIDGYIHINKNIIGRPEYTSDNLIALIIHELSHIFRRHGIRGKNKSNKHLWGLACDHVIDRSLKELKCLFPYQNCFNIIQDLDKALPKCHEEEAYKWLLNNQTRFKQQPIPMPNGENGFNIEDTDTGEEYNVNNISGLNIINPEEAQKTAQKTEQIINNARATNNILEQKSKGTSSNSIKMFLNNLLKVEIKWEDLVEKAIKTNTIMKPADRSWGRLNNYYRPLGINLPGYSMEEQKENVGILIIWVDVSGSISKKELKKFAYIVSQSMQYFEEIHVLVHNTSIIQNEVFNKDEQLKFMSFINNTGFNKGGGTSHNDCYRYIQNEFWNKDNDTKDKLSLIMSLTDGYSDIDENYKNFKWCLSVPTVIVCTSSQQFENKKYNLSTIRISEE